MVTKLKVVHVSTSYNGGAGRAALRIHNSLLKRGVDSSFLCLEKELSKDLINVYSVSIPEKSLLQWQILRIKYRAKRHLRLDFYNYKERIINELNRYLPDLNCETTSLPFSNCNLLEHPLIKNADVIHLHWVSGMLDYPSFFNLNSKPVVWTLHDSNSFRGIFHYEEDELRNKFIENIDNKILSLKVKAIKNRRSKLTLISPSHWLLNDAMESEIFRNVPGKYIRYPLDTNLFKRNSEKEFKKKCKIPEGNIVLLFVAHQVNVHRKGLDLLFGSLKYIKELPITILVLGNVSDLEDEGFDIRSLGSTNDNETLAYYYSNSDAFIIPSREDNLPNTMLEALACGTAVIGFPVGGIRENIINYENGMLADDVDSKSLAMAIKNFCENRSQFSSDKISEIAAFKFNEQFISQKYLDVYKTSTS